MRKKKTLIDNIATYTNMFRLLLLAYNSAEKIRKVGW